MRYVPQICEELPAARGCRGSCATCVGNSGQSSDICISSNGRVVSSTYLFRKYYKTKCTHTGCFGATAKIICCGGSFETADGNGKLTRVVISLKDGKPVSMSWQ